MIKKCKKMANIMNNNRHNIKVKINYDEYWDFHLNKDKYIGSYIPTTDMYDKCLVSYIDFANEKCHDSADTRSIYSLDDYKWISGISTDYTLYNVGYTNVDNGIINYDKHKTTNREFKEISTGSTFTFSADDTRLHLFQVSGNTKAYTYEIDNSGLIPKFKGGFYQGIFKTDCDKYQILPSQIDDCWGFEFTIKKSDYDDLKDNTLNNKFDNKGLFFYIGTRASNKWAEIYNDETMLSAVTDPYLINCFSSVTWSTQPLGDEDEIVIIDTPLLFTTDEDFPIIDDDYVPFFGNEIVGLDELLGIEDDEIFNPQDEEKPQFQYGVGISGFNDCVAIAIDDELPMYNGDYVENDLTIEDFDFATFDYGIPLSENIKLTKILTDNKFLFFHRGCDGFNVGNWIEEDNPLIEYVYPKNNFNGNLFLYMNRTCTGYTVDTIQELYDTVHEHYNIYNDLYNNALTFFIDDNGAIGYKYYTMDCAISGENKTLIKEGKSFDSIIENDKWYTVHVKVIRKHDNMKLMFYVNGKLKYVTSEMPLLNLRKLLEDDEKQEMVAYNISLGGGTQGLSDVVYYNYMKQYDIAHELEENFSGSFNGEIKAFRWFNCELESINILQNYLHDQYELKFLQNYL